jgi:formylglycine-generating enzyme required for sulfatase activity
VEREMLNRIEEVHKRRRTRLLVSAALIPVLLVPIALAILGKIYVIQVTPGLFPEATAHVEKLQGTGVRIGRRYVLFSGEAQLEFSYEGHWPMRQTLIKKSLESVVLGQLQPKAKKVELSSKPAIAVTWLVAGELAGVGTSVTLSLPPNQTVDVEVTGPYGRVVNDSIEIDWREQGVSQREVEVGHWRLELNSEPQGAEVLSGGIELGETPLKLFPLASLEKITLSKTGYRSETLDVASWVHSEQPSLPIKLDVAAKPLPAKLLPAGGTLIGAILSNTGNSITLSSSLPTKVTYAKAGYVAETIEVTDSTQLVNIELKPAVGTLSLLTPVGGEAVIQNFGAHSIPSEVTLPIGDHRLTISSAGFHSQDREITILQDEVTSISQTLETTEAFRIRTAPSRIRAPYDIYLTKIAPDSIALGAPRSQRGQRANELVRRVDFSRQFYVAETEVSEAQFAQFSGASSNSQLPVTAVSWNEAALFCNHLSNQQGLNPFYEVRNGRVVGWYSDSIGYRLPTEAEWEFAATKYRKNKESIFVWGDEFDVPTSGFGNIADKSADGIAKRFVADRSDGYSTLAPVGTFKQAGSISDLSGNVSEWVHDYYSITAPDVAPLQDYQGPTRGKQHFVKGSNYLSSSWTELRASYREPIDEPRVDVGFRIARYVH